MNINLSNSRFKMALASSNQPFGIILLAFVNTAGHPPADQGSEYIRQRQKKRKVMPSKQERDGNNILNRKTTIKEKGL